MNILKIKRALAELVWTGALLFAAASVFLRPGAAAGGVLRGLSSVSYTHLDVYKRQQVLFTIVARI